MIIRSPYPDVEVLELSRPQFVLEHADDRGTAPAAIDGFTNRIPKPASGKVFRRALQEAERPAVNRTPTGARS